jgi:hypothetical protein
VIMATLEILPLYWYWHAITWEEVEQHCTTCPCWVFAAAECLHLMTDGQGYEEVGQEIRGLTGDAWDAVEKEQWGVP